MLNYRLKEVGLLVNHVRCECKQLLLSCGSSSDCVFTFLFDCICDFESFCCFDVGTVTQLQIQLELNFCLLCSNQAQRSLESLENFLAALLLLGPHFHFVL